MIICLSADNAKRFDNIPRETRVGNYVRVHSPRSNDSWTSENAICKLCLLIIAVKHLFC